ncbi:HesA/MoeB/ThiF family protein [Bacillus thuringiensis]|uniref:HesA/MoeB/ThiF family protein n=1 Tax=Bacillus thuringiensis TaxID=1428 RepID=UPI0021D65AFD|nr:HesA/MoeB/ThiF family protein [Bacillus thuringiensis]MCU7666827.1 HesA/MoeB/ThiF family protein [Bacillus thuringiensis]
MKYNKQEKYPPMENSHAILKGKTVAVVGLGGLGSHSAEYAARMGIGTIILIDDDIVEETNLPRQGLYTQRDSEDNLLKANVAAQRLKMINPDVHIQKYVLRLTSKNVSELLEGVDVVLDGTDNLSTRYIINDYCFANDIPWVYASATAGIGTVSNFIPGKTPCFRCVFGDETEEDNASCDINGVILPALTMTTSIQVTEALKILLDKDPSFEEIRYNIWTREESSVDISIYLDEECRCQKKEFLKKEMDNTQMYMICNGHSIQVHTTFSLSEAENNMNHWGFCISRKNDMLVEAVKGESQRIVAFKTGKMVFHHIDKHTIQKML